MNPSRLHRDRPERNAHPGHRSLVPLLHVKDANGNDHPEHLACGDGLHRYQLQQLRLPGQHLYHQATSRPTSPAQHTDRSARQPRRQQAVVLSWTKNTEKNIAGYRVYRSDSATGIFTLLNTTLLNSTSYTDITAPSGTSFYRVTAVDLNGNESAFVAGSATISGGTTPTTITAPSGLNFTSVTSSEIDLAWTDNSNNETGFLIMRKTGATGTYSTIFTTNAQRDHVCRHEWAAGQTVFL